MKRFIITGHKAVADGSFKLDDLGGGAGRVDILCRCVNACFLLSHGVREDVEVFLVLEGGDDAPKTIRIDGSSVRYLNPDERSTASLIRNACLKKLPMKKELVSSPGFSISRKSFAELVEELSDKGTFVYLKEDGTDIRDFQFPENPIFVMGDNQDLTPEEENTLLAHSPSRISVGPVSLHAGHCVVLAHNEMDRRAGGI